VRLRNAALLVMVLAFVAVTGVPAQPPPEPAEACVHEEVRERVRGIMLDGIDLALKNHTVRVFDVWMKDPTDQPRRARVGMRSGILAYDGSRAAILNWNPPTCGG